MSREHREYICNIFIFFIDIFVEADASCSALHVSVAASPSKHALAPYRLLKHKAIRLLGVLGTLNCKINK